MSDHLRDDYPHPRWPEDHGAPPPPIPRIQIELIVDHERTDRVIALLEEILTRTKALQAQGGRTVTSIKEIQDKLAEVQADVESETDIMTAIDTAFEGQNALILDLGARLEQALANQNPAEMQAVLDSLNTIGTTNAANKARMVAAVVKNTPADPQPPIGI